MHRLDLDAAGRRQLWDALREVRIRTALLRMRTPDECMVPICTISVHIGLAASFPGTIGR